MRVGSELKIGIMVITSLAILAILIIVASGNYIYLRAYTIKVHFDYVSGLNKGAPVRLAGMEVGEVKDMALVDNKIEVTLRLTSNVRVKSDSKITINSLGIVGEKYVEITMGTPQGTILKQGSIIQGINPVNVEEMLSRTEAVVYKSEKIVTFIDKMLGGEETWVELDKTIKNTSTFIITLNELLVENKEDINSMIKDLHHITASLKKIIKENSEDIKITTEKLKQTSMQYQQSAIKLDKILANLDMTITSTKKDISTTFAELNDTLDAMQSVLEKVKKGEGAIGKLLSDKELANKLETAAKNIEELTLDLKRHPWKLMRKEDSK